MIIAQFGGFKHKEQWNITSEGISIELSVQRVKPVSPADIVLQIWGFIIQFPNRPTSLRTACPNQGGTPVDKGDVHWIIIMVMSILPVYKLYDGISALFLQFWQTESSFKQY